MGILRRLVYGKPYVPALDGDRATRAVIDSLNNMKNTVFMDKEVARIVNKAISDLYKEITEKLK